MNSKETQSTETLSFHQSLKNEVYAYVTDSRRPHKDEKGIVKKAALLFVVWGFLYAAYLIWGGQSLALNLALSIPWALVMVGIQMSVMHDASHRSASDRSRVNDLLTNSISFLGGSPTLWVYQHCRAHHSFTNVPGKDHDIDTHGLLRLCLDQPQKPIHRYQHIYAWALYPLFVLSWIWWGDYRDIKDNTYSIPKKKLEQVKVETWLVKIWHVLIFLVLPYLLIQNVALVVAGYLLSFGLMGLIMVVVFQLAHVTTTQEFASEEKLKKTDWALFQMASTANFAPNNKFLSWYLGGLNHQIEHHIFPNLSHTHYPEIQHIVKKFCADRGVGYQVFPSLLSAIRHHQRHLKTYGVAPTLTSP